MTTFQKCDTVCKGAATVCSVKCFSQSLAAFAKQPALVGTVSPALAPTLFQGTFQERFLPPDQTGEAVRIMRHNQPQGMQSIQPVCPTFLLL
jgi:hypothetical protein